MKQSLAHPSFLRTAILFLPVWWGLSSAWAVNVTVTLDWVSGFSGTTSTGSALSITGNSIQMGWFSSVAPGDIATTVHRGNLTTHFNVLDTKPYTGYGEYTFEGNNTTVDAPADPDTKTTLYMVLTSGAGDLGIFKWIRLDSDFYIPRGADYLGDRDALATQTGVTNTGAANMVAVVGTVSSNGVTLANVGGGSVTNVVPPSLRLVSAGTPVLSGSNTVVTHTFSGNSNATYVFEYKSSLSDAWKTSAGVVSSSTNFTVNFTNFATNSTNDWKKQMFFRVKNS